MFHTLQLGLLFEPDIFPSYWKNNGDERETYHDGEDKYKYSYLQEESKPQSKFPNCKLATIRRNSDSGLTQKGSVLFIW
jgi:hypothetical protein